MYPKSVLSKNNNKKTHFFFLKLIIFTVIKNVRWPLITSVQFICAYHEQEKENSNAIGKRVLMCLFNDTVYMEFRVYFTIAKYENDIFSLYKTSNAKASPHEQYRT